MEQELILTNKKSNENRTDASPSVAGELSRSSNSNVVNFTENVQELSIIAKKLVTYQYIEIVVFSILKFVPFIVEWAYP